MPRYEVNDVAVRKAQQMIEANQYVLASDWADAQPDSDAENRHIERNGWDAYSEWYLAMDQTANEETKDRFGFPFGDFRRVHRSGLIHAKQRAAQYDHTVIETAADRLLSRLDEQAGDD